MRRARRYTRSLCALGICLALSGAWLNHGGMVAVGDVAVAQWTGWAALSFLLMSQAMAPAARLGIISPTAQAAGRRDFGITSALLATVHVIFGWFKLYLGYFLDELVNTPWLEAGLAAWLLLLVLWFTSYPKLVARLKLRLWKSLHHLAYVAVALAWTHVFLSPWALRWVVNWFGAAIVALWLLRWGRRGR